MTRKNPRIGSTFESWLGEAGIREEVTAAAIKSVIARQIAGEMTKSKRITKARVERHVKRDKKFAAPAARRRRCDALRRRETGSDHPVKLHQRAARIEIGRELRAAKSLMRMFGPRGNPQAKNLFSVIGYLQKRAGMRLHVAG